MADPVITETDLENARGGILLQLESRGLSHLLEDEKFAGFIENEISVIACKEARIRWLYNILHKPLHEKS